MQCSNLIPKLDQSSRNPVAQQFQAALRQESQALQTLLFCYYGRLSESIATQCEVSGVSALQQSQLPQPGDEPTAPLEEIVQRSKFSGFWEDFQFPPLAPAQVEADICAAKKDARYVSCLFDGLSLAALVFWTILTFHLACMKHSLRVKAQSINSSLEFLACTASKRAQQSLDPTFEPEAKRVEKEAKRRGKLNSSLDKLLDHCCAHFLRCDASGLDSGVVSSFEDSMSDQLEDMTRLFASLGFQRVFHHVTIDVGFGVLSELKSAKRLKALVSASLETPLSAKLNMAFLCFTYFHKLGVGLLERFWQNFPELRGANKGQKQQQQWYQDVDPLYLAEEMLQREEIQHVQDKILGKVLHEQHRKSHKDFPFSELLQLFVMGDISQACCKENVLKHAVCPSLFLWSNSESVCGSMYSTGGASAAFPVIAFVGSAWRLVYNSRVLTCWHVLDAVVGWCALVLDKFQGKTCKGVKIHEFCKLFLTAEDCKEIVYLFSQPSAQVKPRPCETSRRECYTACSFLMDMKMLGYKPWSDYNTRAIPGLSQDFFQNGWARKGHLCPLYYNIHSTISLERILLTKELKRAPLWSSHDVMQRLGLQELLHLQARRQGSENSLVAASSKTGASSSSQIDTSCTGLQKIALAQKVLDMFSKRRSLQQRMFHNALIPSLSETILGDEFSLYVRDLLRKFKKTTFPRIACCKTGRQMGKTTGLSMITAMLLYMCNRTSHVIYSTSTLLSKTMLAEVREFFHELPGAGERVLRSSTISLTVLGFGIARKGSVADMLSEGNINVFQVRSTKIQFAKGIRFNVCFIDEASRVEPAFIQEVVAPAMRKSGRVCIMASTTMGPDTYFDRLFYKAEQFRDLMVSVEISLVCTDCIKNNKKAELCHHNSNRAAPWNADGEAAVSRLMIEDQTLWNREMAGFNEDTGPTSAFSSLHVSHLLRKSRIAVPTDIEGQLVTHIDPSGGGPSRMSMCTVWIGRRDFELCRVIVGMGLSPPGDQIHLDSLVRPYFATLARDPRFANAVHQLNIERNYGGYLIVQQIYDSALSGARHGACSRGEQISNTLPLRIMPCEKNPGKTGSFTTNQRRCESVNSMQRQLRLDTLHVSEDFVTDTLHTRDELCNTLKDQLLAYRRVQKASGQITYNGKGNKDQQDDLATALLEVMYILDKIHRDDFTAYALDLERPSHAPQVLSLIVEDQEQQTEKEPPSKKRELQREELGEPAISSSKRQRLMVDLIQD